MASRHGRKSGYSSQPPHHFFRIIFQETIREGKLEIPSKFARDYGNALSSPVSIKVPNGELWEMELKKSNGRMWLQNGWQNFAEHYSLEFGHLLVFRYEGDCRFRVIILDKTTTEMAYPWNEDIQQQKVRREESEDDELQCPRPRKMMKANLTTQQLSTDEKSKALQRASSAFKSTNPFFFICMQPAYVKSCGYLSIPKEFSRKHMNARGTAILCDSNGNNWATEYRPSLVCRRPYVRLCNGWSTFVQDNNLQVGDVCAFELINGMEISFKVFIYRGNFTDVCGHAKRETRTSSSTHQGCLKPLKASETATQRAVKARKRALQRALAFTSENPFFVAVLRPSYIRTHGLLCIPNQFVRKHIKRTLTNIDVILCLSNGKSWLAQYRQRNVGHPYGRICNGWRTFVEDNNLRTGDVCVFELEMMVDAKITFKVFIFQDVAYADYHPSQGIGYPCNEEIQQEVKIEDFENDEPVKIINETSTGTRGKPGLHCLRPHKMMRANPSDISTTQQLKPGKKSVALERVGSAFKSTNPFFLVFMQPAYVSTSRSTSCYLNIPAGFSRKYLNDSGNVILSDSNEKTWAADYCSSSGTKTSVRLCSGWSTFARDNNLQVGDVCAFDLIDCIEVSFKVFIYRGRKGDFHGPSAPADAFCPFKREAGTSSPHQRCLEPLKACETAPQRAAKARERAFQRALAFTSENPFFVVVLQRSHVRTHALRISNQFARKHINRTLTNVDVTLCLSSGKSWPVEYHQRNVGYPNGMICNGWSAFVKDNRLKDGDVCVFEMTDDTKISFKVFIFHAIAVADADCFPSQGVSQKPLDLTSQFPKAAGEKASKPPFFKRAVLPFHLKEQRIDIPFRFAEQYLKPNIKMLTLQVADRSWPVKIKSRPSHRVAELRRGWIEFARENSLREGDICVYELDTVSNGLLKVSISRSWSLKL